MMRKIILSILMVFLIQNIAGAKERQSNPENFEALKLKVLENIGKKRVAMNAFETCVKSALDKKDFKTLLKSDKEITVLISNEEIDALFDLGKIMKNINKVFKKLELIK